MQDGQLKDDGEQRLTGFESLSKQNFSCKKKCVSYIRQVWQAYSELIKCSFTWTEKRVLFFFFWYSSFRTGTPVLAQGKLKAHADCLLLWLYCTLQLSPCGDVCLGVLQLPVGETATAHE